MEDADKNVMKNCARFRREAGLTQQQAADMLDMSVDAVRKWEQGKQPPDRDSLRKLSKMYERTIEEFESANPPKREIKIKPYTLKTNPGFDPAVAAELDALVERRNREHFAKIAEAKKRRRDR